MVSLSHGMASVGNMPKNLTQQQTETKTPKLRFRGFGGVWVEKKLGQVANFLKGKGISKDDISKEGINKCIRYGELYTDYHEIIEEVKSRTNVSKSDSLESEENDVIIPSSGETALDIATVSCVRGRGVLLGGDLNVMRMEGQSGEFFAYYLSNFQNRDIARLAQGNSVVHLYSSHLKDLKINIPLFAEQQKIASFLSSVDKWIENLRTQKENLEQYKKGVMQQIFSQKIRFKNEDGNDFPEWEEKRLGEVVDITTGKKDVNQGNPNGKYPFFTCAREHTYSDEYSFEGEAIMIAGNGEVGLCTYYNGKFEAYQRTYVLQDFKILPT
jgi:type I restriction enzyme, S subunit